MDSQELQRIKDSVYQEGMSELEMKERLYEKLHRKNYRVFRKFTISGSAFKNRITS